MKVGDNKPVPPGLPQEPSSSASPTSKAREGFADQLDEASGATQASPAEGPSAPEASWSEPAGDQDLLVLASRVDRGELSPAEAVRQVVDRVLEAQLPPDATAEMRQRVRDLVEASLDTDPLLRSLVQRLGGGS